VASGQAASLYLFAYGLGSSAFGGQGRVLGAIEMTTGTWVYRLGRRCAADFIALLDQLLRAFPRAR